MVRTTSQDKMKIKNYTKILEIVLDNPGINRKKISQLTHLSNQTLSNLVKELSQYGYITEFTLDDNTALGRKPVGLRLNYKAFTIISVQLTIENLAIYLNACDGTVLWSKQERLTTTSSVSELLKAGVNEALSHAETRVFAIVMSAEGIIDEEHKRLGYVKSLNIKDLDLGKELTLFGLPFFLLNDTNLLCNYAQVGNPQLLNFMVVKLDTGIGCSIALNRHIQKTTDNSMPGKLGHLKVNNTDEENTCWCGGTNCLSTFLSKDFLEKRFSVPYGQALEVIREQGPSGYSEVITKYLSPILANVTVLLGIEKMFVCGRMVEVFGEPFIRNLDMSIAPSIPSWVNFLGLEMLTDPGIPLQCSTFFIHYFIEHILEYLEMIDQTPFTT